MFNKRAVAGTLLAGLLIVGSGLFLWSSSDTEDEEIRTTKAFLADIEQKTVATGSILPRNEVAIKSRVSGLVETVLVEPGEVVEAGSLIATIRVIPDDATLNNAEASLEQASIQRADALAEFERAKRLLGAQAISQAEVDAASTAYQLAQQKYASARSALEVVREGARSGAGVVNTEIRTTVSGMVLTVDVKEGASVIESNTFNEGTPIASVADMSDLIFMGFIDEAEVGKIEEGMSMDITVGAYDDLALAGTLEHISPKGLDQEGAVQFEFRASVEQTEQAFLRAGISANANIVLDRRNQVVAVRETDLNFVAGKPHVDIEKSPGVFEATPVKTGLSDGLTVEILEGVSEGTTLRQLGPARPRGRPGKW